MHRYGSEELEGRVTRWVFGRMKRAKKALLACRECIKDLNQLDHNYSKALQGLAEKSQTACLEGSALWMGTVLQKLGTYLLKTGVTNESFNTFVSNESLCRLSKDISTVDEILAKNEARLATFGTKVERSLQQLDQASKTYLASVAHYLRNVFIVVSGPKSPYSIFGGSVAIKDPFLVQLELYRHFIVYWNARQVYRRELVQVVRDWASSEETLNVEVVGILQELFVLKSKHNIPLQDFIEEFCESAVESLSQSSSRAQVLDGCIAVIDNLPTSEKGCRVRDSFRAEMNPLGSVEIKKPVLEPQDDAEQIKRLDSFASQISIKDEFKRFCRKLIDAINLEHKNMIAGFYARLLNTKSQLDDFVVGISKCGLLFRQSSSIFKSWKPCFAYLTSSKYLHFVPLTTKDFSELETGDPSKSAAAWLEERVRLADSEPIPIVHSLPLYSIANIQIASTSQESQFSITYGGNKKTSEKMVGDTKTVCGVAAPGDKKQLLKACNQDEMTRWIMALRDAVDETSRLDEAISRELTKSPELGERIDDDWNIGDELYEELDPQGSKSAEPAVNYYQAPNSILSPSEDDLHDVFVDNPWEEM